MNAKTLILFVHLFWCSHSVPDVKYEDDDCFLQNEERGRCVRLSQCPSAIEIIQNRQHPEICGFFKFTPIVCCPVSQTLKTRLSNNKCLHYQTIKLKEEIRTTTPFDETSIISEWHNPDIPRVPLTADLYPDLPQKNESTTISSSSVDFVDILSEIWGRLPLIEEKSSKLDNATNSEMPSVFIQDSSNLTILNITSNINSNVSKIENITTTTDVTSATTNFDFDYSSLNDNDTFIIFGTEALPQEFPHMDELLLEFYCNKVSLGFSNKKEIIWSCGGSLVSEKFVLTAAHCLSSLEYGPVEWVSLGSNYINIYEKSKPYYDQKIYKIIRRIHHPNYKRPSSYHDIGLVQLNDTIEFTLSVKPACLYTSYEIDLKTQLEATGWGLTENGGNPIEVLQKVELDIYTAVECAKFYGEMNGSRKLRNGIMEQGQFCAGRRQGEYDTCKGDSGGPLQMKTMTENGPIYTIVGITSFGKSCGLLDVPGVYVRVSHYISWIEQIIWPNEF